MPAVPATAHPDAPPAPLVAAWSRYIRAMEAVYEPPTCLPPEEVQTAATWVGRFGLQPPPAPSPRREAVLTR